jgi:hypothetical protein
MATPLGGYGVKANGILRIAGSVTKLSQYCAEHEEQCNPLVSRRLTGYPSTTVMEEFGECYPCNLGVTEAGDGEDGRIKSATALVLWLEDGIGILIGKP